MKSFALVLVSLFASAAFAAGEGQITMSAPKAQSSALEKNNTSEAGLRYSSINDGTPFLTVGGLHEFDNGFALGVRGYMPLQFNSQLQAYMAEAVARFILLNEQDVIYIDGTLGEGFFNSYNGDFFTTIGTAVGYQRQINEKFGAGGLIGVDYSDKRLSQNAINSDTRTLYSKLGLYGVYYF